VIVINSPVLELSHAHGVLSSVIERASGSAKLWFRLPGEIAALANSNLDAFVAALVLPAMRAGEGIHARGTLSPRLIYGLFEYQRIFRFLLPELQMVPITAEKYAPSIVAAPASAGAAFSGGVDSFYTLLSHLHGQKAAPSLPVSYLVFVHGFDIPLSDRESFTAAEEGYRELAGRLGIKLVPITTNIREVTGSVSWELTHGSALASVAHCLTVLFRWFLIPSTHTYGDAFPWGSDFRVDHLLSTEALEIASDGSHMTRMEKVHAIAGWPEVHSRLRVCWEKPQGIANCGACDKCIRTQTALELLGVRDRFTTFTSHYTAKLAGAHVPRTPNQVSFMHDLLVFAREHGRHDIEVALSEALKRAARSARTQPVRRVFRGLRDRLLAGTRTRSKIV